MMNMHLLNRSGLAAIAAATAFIATPALAQAATPAAAETAPIVADAPLPSEPAPAPEVTTDALAPAPVATATTRTVKANRPAATAARSTAPLRAVAKPTIVAPIAASAAPTPVTVEAPADPAMVAPLPEPGLAAPVAAVNSVSSNDMLPIAGAAGLGILALAGAGFAMRRRRRDDDVVVEQVMAAPESGAAPLTAAPAATAPISAFAWGDRPSVATPAAAPTGLSRIEAAKRGPTPDNPSHSLKKRLSRAAFFDQRERAVAAGTADPVSPMAGLPKRIVRDDQPVRRAAPALGMGFNRRFQPA